MRRSLALVWVVALASCLEPSLATDAGPDDAGATLCGPTTCTGCCLGNVCVGGNQDDACGYDGRTCRRCPTRAMCGAPGTCILAPVDAGAGPLDAGSASFNGPIDPFSGQPLMPPERKCMWVFGIPFCN